MVRGMIPPSVKFGTPPQGLDSPMEIQGTPPQGQGIDSPEGILLLCIVVVFLFMF